MCLNTEAACSRQRRGDSQAELEDDCSFSTGSGELVSSSKWGHGLLAWEDTPIPRYWPRSRYSTVWKEDEISLLVSGLTSRVSGPCRQEGGR